MDGKIVFDNTIKYNPVLYNNLANMYRDIQAIELPDADILLAQFACEADDTRCEKSKDLLKKELSVFFNWYESNKVGIGQYFSHDAISEVIDFEVRSIFGFKLMAADMEVQQASEDKKAWHDLARAYGSRAYAGRTYKDFIQSDWEYISGPLKRYESHFDKKVTDFEKMYDEYSNVGRYLVEKAQNERTKVYKEAEKYKYKLYDEYIEDVYDNFYRFFQPYYDYLLEATNGTNALTQSATSTVKPKNKRQGYGKYNTLEECVPDMRVVDAIDKWADEYYNTHNVIDTIFGRQVFDFLKKYHHLGENKCARDHFGDLLLRRYGKKCSFKNGKSLEGIKNIDKNLAERISTFQEELTKPKEG